LTPKESRPYDKLLWWPERVDLWDKLRHARHKNELQPRL